jgi:hypothetical protein
MSPYYYETTSNLKIVWQEIAVPVKFPGKSVNINGTGGWIIGGDDYNEIYWNLRPDPNDMGGFLLDLTTPKDITNAELILIARSVALK